MNIRSILLLGGTGFIGSHVAHCLSAKGYRVVIPTRHVARASHLILLPTIEVVEADIHNAETLFGLVRDVDAVINLVGTLHSRPGKANAEKSYGPDFAKVHVELPGKLVMACNGAQVQRLLHVSSLGAAADAPSEYLRSKADGEAVIRTAHCAWTIFRPSVVFGPGDNFLNLFADLARAFPVLPLACAETQFQPVYVEDVGAAIVRSLPLNESFGGIYALAGPTVYSLRTLVQYVANLSGHPRPIMGLSKRLAMVQAAILEHLPGQLMSRDNVRSMQINNTLADHGESPLPFGIRPTPLEAIVPAYLGRRTTSTRFDMLRGKAGRA